MIRRSLIAFAALALGACAARIAPPAPPPVAQGPVEVQILAFNDFHGIF
jgi:hypothetical protein